MGQTNGVEDSLGESSVHKRLESREDLGTDGEQRAGRASGGSLIQVHAVLTLVQLGFAGHQILSRVALTSGLSQYVFAIYRYGLGVACMAPYAYFFESNRPPITLKLLFDFFLLGLTGIVGCQQLYLAAMVLTSATFAATMQNAAPVITFASAWILGLEKVRRDRADGLAKVVGTVVCVAGAVVVSVYQGPAVVGGHEAHPYNGRLKGVLGDAVASHATRLGIGEYQIGGAVIFISCFSWAAFLIMQARILKQFPAPVTVTAFAYFFGIIQMVFFMVVFSAWNVSWSLPWGPKLFSVVYAGVISTAVSFSLLSWAIHKGGPVLVSLYNPVQTIFVGALALVFIGDSLYLGTLIGGAGEVAGLYLVSWGQVQHQKQEALGAAARSSPNEADEESVATDPATLTAGPELTHSLLPEAAKRA